MITLRAISWTLLSAGLAVGTLTDTPAPHPPVWRGGYRVVAGDFHLHEFPLSASTLTPWDLMWDAQHQGLDAVAISPHNQVWTARAAHWVARHFGGPVVLVSEEIHGPKFHMIGVGIQSTISYGMSAAETIREIHRQGGVAIAAHPTSIAWPAFDDEAMRLLDASEVWQPAGMERPQWAEELRQFWARKPMAAIGSADWHGMGPPGLCRTWLFVHANTEAAILQAIRERRTVVTDGTRYFGDPSLVPLAHDLPRNGAPKSPLSAVLAILGLLGLVVASKSSVMDERLHGPNRG